jgi:hypothetical protein
MNALDSQLDIFLAAGHDERLKIVYDARREFYKACPGSLVDHEYMITVRKPLTALGSSHTFLAYLPLPLWKNCTCRGGIHF